MTIGSLAGTAEVLKALHALSERRPLPQRERELYDTARHLLVSEVAVSLGMPTSTAEDAIDLCLTPPAGSARAAAKAKLIADRLAAEEAEELLGLGIDGADDGLEDASEESPAEEPTEEGSEDEKPEAHPVGRGRKAALPSGGSKAPKAKAERRGAAKGVKKATATKAKAKTAHTPKPKPAAKAKAKPKAKKAKGKAR
jgi:hypothetical protein